MFEIGDQVKIDANGWLIKADGLLDSIGVVCGAPNFATGSVSVSLSGYPNSIQTLAFEAQAINLQEKSMLATLWKSYTGAPKKTRKKLKLIPA